MFAPELKDAGITPTRKHVFPRIGLWSWAGFLARRDTVKPLGGMVGARVLLIYCV